ncbi:MAG TPA: hypothetical protein VKQ29_04160 [Aliidongia sp.]|nr:hypothetical protein [Aliidongia sp.]
MRMLGLSLLAVAGTLAACAGPADTSSPAAPSVYRTGSLVRQPDGPTPTLTYYTPDQFARSPDQTIGGTIRHSVPTPVPPPPEQPATQPPLQQ